MKLTVKQQEELRQVLSAIWHGDEGMIKHCMTKTKYIVIGGMFVNVCDSKPSIHSDMWYDDETAGPEENKENFVSYNLRMGDPSYFEQSGYCYSDRVELCFMQNYSGQTDNKLVVPVYLPENSTKAIRKVTPEELDQINKAIDEVKEDYRKRLDRYWNRYSDKVSARGYWRNR